MKHYCKDHRGDESVYDPINCDLCKAEAERDMLREWIEDNNPAMDVDVFLSAPGEGERTVRDDV